MKKSIKTITENREVFECEECGRTSEVRGVILQCEKAHEKDKCNHNWERYSIEVETYPNGDIRNIKLIKCCSNCFSEETKFIPSVMRDVEGKKLWDMFTV